jgi:hypothetical protein
MTQPPVITTPSVVQHNAMVNAGFAMSALEMRCFLAMLSRISRDDTVLPVCRIPVRELCADSTSKNVYQEVRAMTVSLAKRALLLEVLGPNGERLPEPDVKNRPLMGAIDYLRREGVVEAAFNEHLRPYLLELKNNFTKAQLGQLLKLKRPASHRIYWLLREYAPFGKRTVSLSELRHVLGLQAEYVDRFDHFKVRVLEPARQELASTDLPFTYELIKQGRTVSEIRFLFAPTQKELPEAPALVGWEAAVVATGVAVASLEPVRAHLAAGDYDEEYIFYVLAQVKKQVQNGKVKKEGGAVYKALLDGYLLPAYQKTKLTPASAKVKASPALSRHRKKLLSELEDAHKSLGWAQTAVIYSDETRPAAIAKIKATILGLEQQLLALGSPSPTPAP